MFFWVISLVVKLGTLNLGTGVRFPDDPPKIRDISLVVKLAAFNRQTGVRFPDVPPKNV